MKWSIRVLREKIRELCSQYKKDGVNENLCDVFRVDVIDLLDEQEAELREMQTIDEKHECYYYLIKEILGDEV